MKIFINNEEVVCDKNVTIKNQLSSPSSAILNNVYPKSWESDKDYTSRFYMPKDYSKCVIKEGEEVSREIDLSNNFYTRDNRIIVGNTNKIQSSSTYDIQYIPVTPGKTYKLETYLGHGINQYIYESDVLDVETIATRLQLATAGTHTYEITPTKKYIATTIRNHTGTTYLEMKSIKLVTDNNVIFAGYVKNSGNVQLNPRYPHYSALQIIDYSNLLSEGDLLDFVLKPQTISEAIKKVIENQDGFMVGGINIDSDDEISAYNCSQKTPNDVLNYLAEITGSIWFTRTIDDGIVVIDFYSPGLVPGDSDVRYNQDYFEDKNIQDMYFSYNTRDYRNKQVITNDEGVANTPQVEVATYDGNTIQTNYNIAKVESIKCGNRSYSVSERGSGKNTWFHYSIGTNQITADPSLETGYIFTITYYPIVQLHQTAYNQDEIARIKTDSVNGIISRYEKRTDTNNEDNLNKIAQTYIEYKSTPEVILTIKTHDKDLLGIGTQVLFDAPIEDLKTRYLVKSKTTEMIVIDSVQKTFYTYELSSSFNDENAINFFDNQRRKLEGNLQDDEYISRYIDIPSQTNIVFYGATIEPIEIPVNVLDSELEVEL